jgi:hypothetical protein
MKDTKQLAEKHKQLDYQFRQLALCFDGVQALRTFQRFSRALEQHLNFQEWASYPLADRQMAVIAQESSKSIQNLLKVIGQTNPESSAWTNQLLILKNMLEKHFQLEL